ncbi:hypothetical protein FOZ63_014522 [Perkinsus olseni]|uniref:Uncharacterized protein n=1 Tax=Perkinsus olseni TaxID=32597 RepID=A0A7J6NLA6_PEROL|nr:hypothetical protein FOZ60_007839 [Perkinsus olseni]KAF4707925.1 hypothetical protein FOZ63_014522 [Perkinsus olseni]KAF4741946.1 hypothetical protein FOZ62_013143 [Perkinsus olseni]
MTTHLFVLFLIYLPLSAGYFWLKVPDDMMLRMLQHRKSNRQLRGEPIPLDVLQPEHGIFGDDDFFEPVRRNRIFDDMAREFGDMERGFGMIHEPAFARGGLFGLDRLGAGGEPSQISETSSSVESHETYVNDGQHKPLHTATMVGSSEELHGDDSKHLSGDAAAVKCKDGKCVTVHAKLKPKRHEDHA